ncbi:MAG: hypothetical protein UY64_C0030G0010, partial [Parcubacteria group bacterium GW2011_GWA1_51_12]
AFGGEGELGVGAGKAAGCDLSLLGRRDGLPIRFIRKLPDGYALVATIRQSDWSLRAAAEMDRLKTRNIPGERFSEPDFSKWDIPEN